MATETTRKVRRVLLVEDEPAFRELIAHVLQVAGFDVHVEADGWPALRYLAREAVDLVVTDLCMPKTDGLEFLMQLRELPRRIPTIVMSGGIAGESGYLLRTAKLLGARATLAKPFALEQLVAVARSAVEHAG